MGLLKGERGGRCGFFWCVFLCLMFRLAAGNVVLIGKNVSLSFDDIEANFAPRIKASGECGVLYTAEPLDACTPLTNKVVKDPYSPFVLIKRGGCTFDDKVNAAQHAGFKAAIVYNNEDSSSLVSMSGTLGGITIHAVFVAKSSGEILKKYTGRTDVEFWIIPTYENSAWSIIAISFISLIAISSALATCFFVRRHRIRREHPRAPNIRDFHGMSHRLVKKMPSLKFTSVLEDNCTSRTCAICLEDYDVGEKLRVLPCHHKFHALCVDAWLTTWRTFCPMCKQDANTSTSDPPASESTPLLSSAASSPSSSTASLSSFHSFLRASPSSSAAEALSSFRSSLAVSPSRAIPISPMMMHRSSPLTSRTPSLSAASRLPPIPNPRRSYNNASLAIGISRSSLDLRNASSPHRSQLVSPHSLGYPLSSPMNSRYLTPFIPSSTNASPNYLAGSSGRQSYLRHCTESGVSLSAQDSALSLPGC